MMHQRPAGAAVVAAFAITFAAAGTATTAALVTDADDNRGNVIIGAERLQDVPPECLHLVPFHNVLIGSDDDDEIRGEHGRKDLIIGLGGDDLLYGDSQDDCLVGGSGDDQLFGENGKDVLLGGSGNDTLSMDEQDNGKDSMYGGPGDDVISGGNAPDRIDGGDGNDECYGGRAPDHVDCEVSTDG